MMFTTLAAGLNRQGLMLTWDLNPRFTQTVPLGELAEVKVYVLSDGTIIYYTPEGRAFRPDESSFHPDDCRCPACCRDTAETPKTGLDPQADPERLRPLEVSTAPGPEDTGASAPQTASTGLSPQADPAKGFVAMESTSTPQEGTKEAPQTTSSGLNPQADPVHEFKDKESSFAPDDGVKENPATTNSNLDPQADPAHEFKDKESGSEEKG